MPREFGMFLLTRTVLNREYSIIQYPPTIIPSMDCEYKAEHPRSNYGMLMSPQLRAKSDQVWVSESHSWALLSSA